MIANARISGNGCTGRVCAPLIDRFFRFSITPTSGQSTQIPVTTAPVQTHPVMRTPTPYVMSWNLQYLGSKAVGKVTSESLERRMRKILRSETPSQSVYLSISLNGVYVAKEDQPKRPFLVHSIRRVCCVVGKVETRQIAYVTKCEADDGKTSKECHIFRTSNRQQVDEIESVLSSTFQRIVFVDNPLPPLCSSDEASDTTISSGTARSNSLPEVPNPPAIQSSTSDSSEPESPVKKRQMSAAVFFQKFFGTPSRAAMKNVDLENLTDGTDPSTLTPIRSGKTAADRSRKRPVSAVFGQAMRHAASTLTPKKSSTLTYSSTPRPPTMKSGGYRNNLQEIHEHQPVASTRPAPKPEPVLQFDDNIGEFVFPIGEFMDDQLQRLAYFCRNPNRFEVYSALQQMPEGAFVLRYSESRRRCLALSVRVPDAVDTHGTRVAHYLIVRNEQGFRLHGSQRHFTSLPMLITHYTVLPELLPCRLIFVEWDKALLRGRTPVYHGRLVNLDDRSDYSTPIGLENLTALRSPMKKVPRRCSLDFSQL